jgi:hypothetical protein
MVELPVLGRRGTLAVSTRATSISSDGFVSNSDRSFDWGIHSRVDHCKIIRRSSGLELRIQLHK